MSAFSTISSVTSITRTSIHTNNDTINLARICDDLNCIYPYGPACKLCSLAVDIKEDAVKQRPHPTYTVAAWVDEVKVNRDITLFAGEKFTGGADDDDSDITLIERQAAAEDDYVDEGDAVDDLGEFDEWEYKAEEEEEEEEAEEAELDDGESDTTQVPTYVRSPTYNNILGRASCSRTAFNPSTAVHERHPISPWLDTVFDHTLNGQLEDIHFTSGADFQRNPDVENCVLCTRPVGDPTFQHYLKCKYAHEEAERMAEWGAKWSPSPGWRV
ncbi:hypothetical protein ONS95_005422 [Cadophora gregata]|uniref:uncharacterized protein n=1 Tax=Cadophora gregata TaxID=51156 RepID=UPI0026DB0764|nr:uncharacterized protein ONS95_005422 [Cadophora gregata]KAK0103396.1 hypothetical protein ONS95_005422 [Cadophora gregata]KAK0107586.1 hypothetical protein ONS96_003392 [Cadophora gregata f. sp. sojae]